MNWTAVLNREHSSVGHTVKCTVFSPNQSEDTKICSSLQQRERTVRRWTPVGRNKSQYQILNGKTPFVFFPHSVWTPECHWGTWQLGLVAGHNQRFRAHTATYVYVCSLMLSLVTFWDNLLTPWWVIHFLFQPMRIATDLCRFSTTIHNANARCTVTWKLNFIMG